MPTAVIIGASYGIGKALAYELARRGYNLGLAARSLDLLEEIKRTITTPCTVMKIDLNDREHLVGNLKALIAQSGDVDTIVINAGIFSSNKEFLAAPELATIEVNVCGFVSVAVTAYNHFKNRKGGTLVGISSIAGIRGGWRNPSYNASKAFVSNYLEGLAYRATKEKFKLNTVDVRPGFVATPLTSDFKGMFWVAPVEEAAKQIADGIAERRTVFYVLKRWLIIAWLLRLLPRFIYFKTGS